MLIPKDQTPPHTPDIEAKFLRKVAPFAAIYVICGIVSAWLFGFLLAKAAPVGFSLARTGVVRFWYWLTFDEHSK